MSRTQTRARRTACLGATVHMSEISSIGLGQGGPNPLNRSSASPPVYHRNGVHAEPKPDVTAGDRVDLSEHAQLIARLRALPEVRTELIEQARTAVNDPSYLNDDRLNVAIDRLLQDIDLDDSLE